MMMYKKKAIVIEAVKWDGKNRHFSLTEKGETK